MHDPEDVYGEYAIPIPLSDEEEADDEADDEVDEEVNEEVEATPEDADVEFED